ncbi:hypothetical protein [Undibacterium sp. Xuan67W]|uniref:hypothetical protein n=1 Tax=Undibacterium sp. Xuan67W TaxID=3413057 RepID=UPI003BF30FB7
MKSSYLSRRHRDHSVIRHIGALNAILSALMIPLLLSACGGNSAGDNKTTLPTISGTAATGMAIASTDVSVSSRQPQTTCHQHHRRHRKHHPTD